jgi:hypothetical protein
MLPMASSNDIQARGPECLNWKCSDAIGWYLTSKKTKSRYSRWILFLAVTLTAAAGVAPLAEPSFKIPPGLGVMIAKACPQPTPDQLQALLQRAKELHVTVQGIVIQETKDSHPARSYRPHPRSSCGRASRSADRIVPLSKFTEQAKP